jgi:hypothetical protein
VWSLASGEMLFTIQAEEEDWSVAVSPDGQSIVRGTRVWGLHQTFVVLGSTEGLDTSWGRWSALSDLNEPRWQHAAAAADAASLVVTGGLAGDGSTLATAELYDAVTDTWDAQAVPPMLTPRAGHALVALAAGGDGVKAR